MVDDDEKEWELLKIECSMSMLKANPLVTKRIRERRKESMEMMKRLSIGAQKR